MSLGEQPAVGVDRQPPADGGDPVAQELLEDLLGRRREPSSCPVPPTAAAVRACFMQYEAAVRHVSFAVPAIAPNKQVPRLFLARWPLKLNSFVAGQVQINWSGNWDRDNETLTYRLYREGTSAPIFEITMFGTT